MLQGMANNGCPYESFGESKSNIQKANVGNFYLNRDIVGAVVGVQPFGGHGLSGTGPKAGGPKLLKKFSK